MWYDKTIDEVLKELKTSRQGLSQTEAIKRLQKYGPNEIVKPKKVSPLLILLNQFRDIFVIILIIAMILSVFFGERADALAIALIVILNAVIGFVQEYKAEKSMEALKKYLSLKAKVIRNGEIIEIDAKELVPGDIVILEEGVKIPADGRLIEANELKVNEAVLTGESVPISKTARVIKKVVRIPEMKNMVFAGTFVTRGRGLFVVTSTGRLTEIGKIAKATQEIKDVEPPLKIKLKRFAKKLAYAIIAIVAIIFLIETIRAVQTNGLTLTSLVRFFMISVALAVSAVPEGLPAVVTISLSLGAREMAKRNVLVRKLASVETLGSVDVLCVDKTGTLTKGEMTVRKIFVNGKVIDVSGVGYEPKGEFKYRNRVYFGPDLKFILTAGALASNARLAYDDGKYKIIGDTTEGALVVAAKKANLDYSKFPRLKEFPFSSERKMMSTINVYNNRKFMFTKGAFEVVIEKCSKVYKDGRTYPLIEKEKKRLTEINDKFAKNALRVLAIAYKEIKKDEKEDNLVFLGLVGIIDPPRDGVKKAFQRCLRAGVKTVMITGDHKLTAEAIAKEIGILNGGKVLTGKEVEKMSDEELEKVVDEVCVFSRILPIQKLRIVKALKKKGHVVAMTGDGVNDAPALKSADIGIAVGSGTDVAKEASDMILLDDNYVSIVKAIEKGREIYSNIRKFAFFLMRSNFDEVFLIGTFAVLGMPLPLTAPMILWQNLVTDGGPALALSVDPPTEDLMAKPPRPLNEGILHGRMAQILVSFLSQYFSSLIVFLIGMSMAGLATARTMVFVQATLRELVVVWNCRSEKKGIFRLNPLTNPYLIVAVAISALATVLLTTYSPLMALFQTTPLTLKQWSISLAFALSGVLIVPELFYNKEIKHLKILLKKMFKEV